jgi:mono/diheme cytochrome c family protein
MNRTAAISGFVKATPVLALLAVGFALLGPVACTTDPKDEDDCISGDSLCLTTEQFLAKGDTIYQNNCSGCHGTDGMGGVGHGGDVPPLKNSDFLMAERLRPVRIVLRGLPNAVDTATTITVNGNTYTNIMPAILSEGSNLEIAAVLSFVRDSLNGGANIITPAEVATVRASLPAAE